MRLCGGCVVSVWLYAGRWLQAEELGCEGEVEEAQGIMLLCEKLKEERSQLESVSLPFSSSLSLGARCCEAPYVAAASASAAARRPHRTHSERGVLRLGCFVLAEHCAAQYELDEGNDSVRCVRRAARRRRF